MDWNVLLRDVLAQLGTVAVIVAALGWIGKVAVQKFFESGVETLKAELRRRNDLELAEVRYGFSQQLLEAKAGADRERERLERALDAQSAAQDRLRGEILAWSNPVLDAVRGLERRLDNVLLQGGHVALDAANPHPIANWSATYDYFIGSTIYLFGCYFCWIRSMELELSFELLQARAAERALFDAISTVAQALGDYPPQFPGTGRDMQVFRLQQRAMGELLAVRRGDGKRGCVGYATFLSRWVSGTYGAHFDPLLRLVDGIKPGERRFNRLLGVHAALKRLCDECERLLEPPPAPAVP